MIWCCSLIPFFFSFFISHKTFGHINHSWGSEWIMAEWKMIKCVMVAPENFELTSPNIWTHTRSNMAGLREIPVFGESFINPFVAGQLYSRNMLFPCGYVVVGSRVVLKQVACWTRKLRQSQLQGVERSFLKCQRQSASDLITIWGTGFSRVIFELLNYISMR